MSAPRYSPSHFPAPVVRSRAAGDFVLTETRYDHAAVLPAHAHEYPCLVVVLDGTFEERCDGRERLVEPKSILVRPAGEVHSDAFRHGGARCLNIELPPRWLARVRDAAKPLDRSGAHSGGAFAAGAGALYTHFLDDEHSSIAIESLILHLFAEDDARGSSRIAPPWLVRVREVMHEQAASKLSLAGLADVAGVHPVHLAASFRRCYGTTVAAYLRQLRVELACRELVRSDAPLADVALAAGFADQSHFGRTMKRALGVTPAAFRAANRS
ncbi:MAG TPA: AraC family transcriptional regulator [Thermoanaerobaculia bacterium]|nr:AraC family transcriptional regulator [Thermoanaerobaculia bacterium]